MEYLRRESLVKTFFQQKNQECKNVFSAKRTTIRKHQQTFFVDISLVVLIFYTNFAPQLKNNVQDQETRHIFGKAVHDAFCRNIFHQPLRADDAVSMAICR